MKTYFIQKNDENWSYIAQKIKKADWGGAKHLGQKMLDHQFNDWEGVIYLEENNQLAGFCSIVKEDIADNLTYTPYIAVVYVFPEYRGQFLARKLVKRSEEELKRASFEDVYLITQLVDFYEKMDYSKIDEVYDQFNRLMTVYHKKL